VQLRNGAERHCDLGVDGASWMPLIRGAEDGAQRRSRLQDLCVRISCGVATGADDVFVWRKKELSPELMAFSRPTLAGRELTAPGELPQAENVMLLPYTEDGGLIDEHELGALGSYLGLPTVRHKLLRRTCVRRKPWYSFHETPPLGELLRPKILCKDITQNPHFWIDRKGDLVPRHSIYYIIREKAESIDDLCAYLNSKRVAEWLFEHCQRVANGFLRLQSNVLKSVPMPDEFGTIQRKRRLRKKLAGHAALPGFAFSETAR
jgi:hypothetical protein